MSKRRQIAELERRRRHAEDLELLRLSKMSEAQARSWVRAHRYDEGATGGIS